MTDQAQIAQQTAQTHDTALLRQGRALYAALAGGDVEALQRLLSEDFEGELTAGLPHGFGRRYVGREAMMGEGWGAVGEWFEMAPEPARLIDGGDMLVAHGDYVGRAKPTGKPVRAAFAHFWAFDGERFTGVKQVTDSGLWRDALAA